MTTVTNTPTTPTNIWQNPIHFIAFGFGAGALPIAPGTWGTVVGVFIYLLLENLNLTHYLLILGIATLIGIWLCHVTSKQLGVYDHPGIVFDEILGYLATMITAPHGWQWVLLGFILFRIFDILKPWPISWAENKFKNGLGIVLDDLLAAVPAFCIIQLGKWLFVR